MRAKLIEFVIAAIVFATPACAAGIVVSDAWIRALPAKLPAAGYFTMKNTGAAEIALTATDTPACGMLMLHKSSEMGGMGSMEDVASVAVPAGGTVKFAPGGYHLMCMDPTEAIKPGGHIAVTLHFSDGGKTVVDFPVKNAQGK